MTIEITAGGAVWQIILAKLGGTQEKQHFLDGFKHCRTHSARLEFALDLAELQPLLCRVQFVRRVSVKAARSS